MTAGGRSDENAEDGPEAAEEGAIDEVGGVDEEDVSPSPLGGVEDRLEFGFQERPLLGGMLGQRLFGGTGMARVRCQVKPRPARKVRVWVRPRRRPVSW